MRKIKRAGTRRADFELATAARDAIRWMTTVPAEAIRITAHNGHLDLGGRVEALHQRTAIEDLTRALPGVRGVTNSIYVGEPVLFGSH